ncbi:hypothetical protein AmaxDRAFT_1083 [Limnospira maxima CS-328]|uniref:Uncharacterized protein n=1 Tax=Limnospira maxima CS-328 TaxID=513049 RepID=B5VX41_LIMMA|nr:hypothetical protein AmaxDRAFT_1083 [Limnospira maxima CS-328]
MELYRWCLVENNLPFLTLKLAGNSRLVGFPLCRHWGNNHRGNIKVVSLANSLFSAIAISNYFNLPQGDSLTIILLCDISGLLVRNLELTVLRRRARALSRCAQSISGSLAIHGRSFLGCHCPSLPRRFHSPPERHKRRFHPQKVLVPRPVGGRL